jgi:hypothetical protein
MTYVHRKLVIRPGPNPYMPRATGDRRSWRAEGLASVKQKGDLPAYNEFINLCGATSDIVLWLEVEEPELAELTPISHKGMREPERISTAAPSEIYHGYEAAFRDDMERASWAANRSDALDAQWQSLSTFPAHWWLSQQPGWAHIFAALLRKARQAKPDAYHHGLARFRLLGVITITVGQYLWRKRMAKEPVIASRAEFRKALRHVRGLLQVLTPGVVNAESSAFFMLAHELKNAEAVLTRCCEPPTLKRRNDQNLLAREFLKDVVIHLERTFGEASPTLVADIASIAGYNVHDTTLRRIRASTTTRAKRRSVHRPGQ